MKIQFILSFLLKAPSYGARATSGSALPVGPVSPFLGSPIWELDNSTVAGNLNEGNRTMNPGSEHGSTKIQATTLHKCSKKKTKQNQQHKKQRTLNFTNTGRATAGQPRLKERERAPPTTTSPAFSSPSEVPEPARARFYSPVQMTLFQLR